MNSELSQGITQLSELPQNWKLVRFRHAFRIIKRTYNPDVELLSVYLQKGVIPHSEGGGQVHKPSEDLSGYQEVAPGDFVLNNQQAWRGSVGVSPISGNTSPAYVVARFTRDFEPRYMNYLLRSPIMVSQYELASRGVGDIQRQLHLTSLKQTLIPFPPLEEQRKIANFLDTEVGQIDKLLEKQDELISKLNLRKTAIIADSVSATLGQISSTVSYDATELPSGWSVVPAWTQFRRIKRVGFEAEELLSVYRDHGVIPKSSRDDNHNVASEDLSSYQLVEVGDLVLNKMKAWQGSLAFSQYRGIVSPAYFVYRNIGNGDPKFLHYLLRSAPYIAAYNKISKGVRVGQWDLDPQEFRKLPILLPPNEEQRRIANYIDRELAQIDELIIRATKFIELASERRARLIAVSVTEGVGI